MRTCSNVALALFLGLALAGCAGQDSYESLKNPDYRKMPSTVLAIHLTTTPLDNSFEGRIVENFAKCGVTLSFTKSINPKIVASSRADGVLTFEVLSGTQTFNWKDPAARSSVRSVDIQMTLVDVESEKNVWKSRTDLHNGVDGVLTKNANQAGWADELTNNMA